LSETRWQRYRHRRNPKIEYDVEYGFIQTPDEIKHVPLECTMKDSDGWHRGCFYRIRTIRNHYYEEGRHIPAYTYLSAERFGELYERV
jgi:hypothetical protein